MICKIISGGQTGADIAAIDAAIANNIPWSGYIPKGRKNENGRIDETYDRFIEMDRGGYPMRTKKNVESSDLTVIFNNGPLRRGTLLTYKHARKRNVIVLIIDVSKNTAEEAATKIREFSEIGRDLVINVAGPRTSKDPLIYSYVYKTIDFICK